MGNILIIKNADFSLNAIGPVGKTILVKRESAEITAGQFLNATDQANTLESWSYVKGYGIPNGAITIQGKTIGYKSNVPNYISTMVMGFYDNNNTLIKAIECEQEQLVSQFIEISEKIPSNAKFIGFTWQSGGKPDEPQMSFPELAFIVKE